MEFAAAIEAAVRDGRLAPGERLPAVRALATRLGVSPATVAAGYRRLQMRGLLVADGRRGTRVSHLPLAGQPACPVPALRPGTVDLSDGNPDPALLPPMAEALARIDASPRLYGGPAADPGLLATVEADLRSEGVAAGETAFVNGAADAIDRLLADNFRPGDRIAIEDPIYGNLLDLALAKGLRALPVALDGEGPLPDALERALAAGASGLLVTPRAQNPTGAALSATRARELSAVLARHPGVLVIEDDHLAGACEEALEPLHRGRARWAYVRSYSKALNPDLRLAAVRGDDRTLRAIQDRLVLGERWVSHILQRTANALLSDPGVRRALARAARSYGERRRALVAALAGHGISTPSRSGYNVWVPVAEETPPVQALAERGWAVRAGERFRLRAPPALRITAARLEPPAARRFAADLAAVLAPHRATATT